MSGPSSAGESFDSSQPDGGPGTGWREDYVGGSREAEQRLFAQFERLINQIQASLQAATGSAVVRRGFHAKIHAGITNAEFRVLADIPADLQIGPFKPGAVYPATVRFSNASGRVEPDGKRDLRGIAFRITTNGGDSQDFLLTNATASHARDARQFMAVSLFDANPSKLRALPALVRQLGVRETLRIVRVVMKSARRVESLATQQYWNRAPLAWGKYAVRFDLKPAPEVMREPAPPVDQFGANYLRDDLHQRLLRGALTYHFRVQRFVDAGRTPIEDGAAEWREQDSPATTIAELVIPRQDLRAAEAVETQARVDALEFSPWNTTEAFRPLGNLNRARNPVYRSSADFRAGRKSMAGAAQSRPRPPEGGDARQATLGTAFWLVLRGVFGLVNRFVPWHRLPPFIGIFNLGMFREVLRRENQYGTYLPPEAGGPKPQLPPFETRFLSTRISEGFYNQTEQPEMGSVGRRFLRNVPLKYTFPDQEPELLKPSPREVSNRLLARQRFLPATSLNLLAAAWIQFQIHDWVGHASAPPGTEYEIPLAEDDTWEPRPMRLRRTAPDSTRTAAEAHLPPTFRNRESHWWDGSQIYGSSDAATQKLRTGRDGKLRIDDESFLLPIDPETRLPLTGFTDNWWVGLSLMHTLFAREHNSICDRLRADFADWPDDKVFDTARLVNTALMVKIHNLDWTPAILAHPTLRAAMKPSGGASRARRCTGSSGVSAAAR